METTSINPTDIAVIVILLLSALLAFARGLVREVLSVGAWVGAAFATLYLFPHVLPMVQQIVAKELIAKAVAGIDSINAFLAAYQEFYGKNGALTPLAVKGQDGAA